MPRRIEFTPAYDKRDPDPQKNYGIHGVEIRWLLEGPRGVIQFVIYTNWHLPEVQLELDLRSLGADLLTLQCSYHPQPADIGYHSYTPLREWQKEPTFESCEYLRGKPCYYDGSSLGARVFFQLLVKEGQEAVWQRMEEYYRKTFGEPSSGPLMLEGREQCHKSESQTGRN